MGPAGWSRRPPSWQGCRAADASPRQTDNGMDEIGERMSDFRTIRYQRHGDVGTLTLARPDKRNAQNPLMWDELARLGAELLPDETLRCLVVTGDGPAFS